MTTLQERLLVALARSGRTQAEVARRAGVTRASVNGWTSGRTKSLSGDVALKAAQALGVSVDWLVSGKGEMDVPGSVHELKEDDALPPGIVRIPMVEIRFSAGPGSEQYDEVVEEHPAYFDAAFFKKRHVSPENCKVFRVSGASMEPLISDGDAILVDCSPDQRIQSGKVYAFSFDRELRVKRLERRLDGTVVVRSENPEYPQEVVAADDWDANTKLIGLVLRRSGSV